MTFDLKVINLSSTILSFLKHFLDKRYSPVKNHCRIYVVFQIKVVIKNLIVNKSLMLH